MLKDKVAVVTGGSRGIGRAICERFIQNGASVAFLYAGDDGRALETEKALNDISSDNARAKAYKCNVADSEAVAETLKRIMSDFTTVDILVNNAGITRDKPVISMRDADFDDVINVNLRGAFLMIRQVYPVFMRKRSGKIINISSIAGITGNAGQANYSASKAGIIGLTKSVAKELAGRGVNCNAIAPGFIETDMTASIDRESSFASSIPMKRFGLPYEVADTALFLASPMSAYITGEVIKVDGGLST